MLERTNLRKALNIQPQFRMCTDIPSVCKASFLLLHPLEQYFIDSYATSLGHDTVQMKLDGPSSIYVARRMMDLDVTFELSKSQHRSFLDAFCFGMESSQLRQSKLWLHSRRMRSWEEAENFCYCSGKVSCKSSHIARDVSTDFGYIQKQ